MPIHTTGAAAALNRRQPSCIPPSNSTTISATVTIRCTFVIDNRPTAGTRSEAIAAAMRKIAGAGTRIRSLSRFDSTATVTASAITPMSNAKRPTSLIRSAAGTVDAVGS